MRFPQPADRKRSTFEVLGKVLNMETAFWGCHVLFAGMNSKIA